MASRSRSIALKNDTDLVKRYRLALRSETRFLDRDNLFRSVILHSDFGYGVMELLKRTGVARQWTIGDAIYTTPKVVPRNQKNAYHKELSLLEELGIAKINWKIFGQDTRNINERELHVSFDVQKAAELRDAIDGTSALINVRALQTVAMTINRWLSTKIAREIFYDLELPESLMGLHERLGNGDVGLIPIFIALNSTGDIRDFEKFLRFLTEAADPLNWPDEPRKARIVQKGIVQALGQYGLTFEGGVAKMRLAGPVLYLEYDESDGTIVFNNDLRVQLSKKVNTDVRKLMSVLAKDPSKEWTWDDVVAALKIKDSVADELPTGKFYNSARNIKKIVKKIVPGVDDFLLYTPITYKINEKYLPKKIVKKSKTI